MRRLNPFRRLPLPVVRIACERCVSGAPLFRLDISSTKMTRTCIIVIFALALTGAAPASAREVYLDKVDKNLDNLWNYLDGLCRGGSGDEAATNKACDQRLEVDKIIMKMGCSNIYPATGETETSHLEMQAVAVR